MQVDRVTVNVKRAQIKPILFTGSFFTLSLHIFIPIISSSSSFVSIYNVIRQCIREINNIKSSEK